MEISLDAQIVGTAAGALLGYLVAQVKRGDSFALRILDEQIAAYRQLIDEAATVVEIHESRKVERAAGKEPIQQIAPALARLKRDGARAYAFLPADVALGLRNFVTAVECAEYDTNLGPLVGVRGTFDGVLLESIRVQLRIEQISKRKYQVLPGLTPKEYFIDHPHSMTALIHRTGYRLRRWFSERWKLAVRR